MSYQHGTYVYENDTAIIAPIESDSAVQVVVGTAPVNMAGDISNAVNKPVIVYSYAEAVKRLGYSSDFKRFTLCQSMDASFRVFNVAPLIFINVLDPARHKKSTQSEELGVVNGQFVIPVEGVLPDTVKVSLSEGGEALEPDDYVAAFDDSGYYMASLLTAENPAKVYVSYDCLDPDMVTESDIVGGYNVSTGDYKGLELIGQIYPRLNIVPGQILAPGWSHRPVVNAVMSSKTTNISGSFKCIAISDINTVEAKTYDEVNVWKNKNGYVNENLVICWPMVEVGGKRYYMSAMWAALTAYVDASRENVPYKSPSNEVFRITGTVLADGTEVYLDQVQGNYLNGLGVCTSINMNGWKSWGNNTSIYPSSTDVKDRWIAIRRMFNWWGNSFILTYFQKVDDPMNRRLIESIVDSENIRANGYVARGMIAGAVMEYNPDENPITDILNGILRFKQNLAFFTPAEQIINVLEFDPYMLQKSLAGGEA